jgi:AcrR family transcriptional regulator
MGKSRVCLWPYTMRKKLLLLAFKLIPLHLRFYSHVNFLPFLETTYELVAQYLQRLAEKAKSSWDRLEAAHPGNPIAQLRAWLRDMATHVASRNERGCPLANATVELPEKHHPARRVIEAFKRERLIQLCAKANLAEPETLADELFLLLEGARVTAQSMGPKGLGDRLVRMGDAMIKAHTIIAPAKSLS